MSTAENKHPAGVVSNPWHELALTIVVLGSGIATLLAWVLPAQKPGAVLGRLSYLQAAAAVALSALFVTATVILLTPSRGRRRRTFRLCALWLGASAALALAEVVAWLLPIPQPEDNPWYTYVDGSGLMMKQSDRLMFERPAHLQWRGLSEGDFAIGNGFRDPYARMVTFQTDHEGFRNSTDRDAADIVFIGDSHTEAGNMPEVETFAVRTARALNLSVRNLGRACHGPSEERIILERYGLNCRPKVVVWQFCENNDLEEEVLFDWWNNNGRPRVAELQNVLSRSDSWKLRSPTYRLFQRLRQFEPWEFQGRYRDADGDEHPMLFDKPPDAENRPEQHPGWPLLVDALEGGAALLDQHGIELIVIHIPKKVRVMGHHVDFPKAVRRRLSTDWDLEHEQTLAWHLEQLCRELEVQFVDTTEMLRACAANGEMVYLPMDSHLSSRGHAAVAELLADAISTKLSSVPTASQGEGSEVSQTVVREDRGD